MKTIKLLLFSAIFQSFAFPAWSFDAASEGIKAFRMGNYSGAEQLYKQALSEERENDKLAAIYRNLSLLYSTQGKDGSEFARKADELDPPATLKRIDQRNGDSALMNSKATPPVVYTSGDTQQQKQQNMQQGSPTFSLMRSNSSLVTPSIIMGAGSGRGFSLNGYLGGARSDSFVGNPAFGIPGNSFSVQTPNSHFEYSDRTPVILTAPNTPPVIINAPGPNIYSSQQAPDGSTTTIQKRTY